MTTGVPRSAGVFESLTTRIGRLSRARLDIPAQDPPTIGRNVRIRQKGLNSPADPSDGNRQRVDAC